MGPVGEAGFLGLPRDQMDDLVSGWAKRSPGVERSVERPPDKNTQEWSILRLSWNWMELRFADWRNSARDNAKSHEYCRADTLRALDEQKRRLVNFFEHVKQE
jgi:hypothetical protein